MTNPRNSTVKFGDQTVLNCTSRGGPSNQYKWTHYPSQEIVNNKSSLNLSLSSLDVFGSYVCTVSNRAGSDNSETGVNGMIIIYLRL